ncbi:MAG: hypothetical protein WCG01_04380 [bacterium]
MQNDFYQNNQRFEKINYQLPLIRSEDITRPKSQTSIIKRHQIANWLEQNPARVVIKSVIIKSNSLTSDTTKVITDGGHLAIPELEQLLFNCGCEVDKLINDGEQSKMSVIIDVGVLRCRTFGKLFVEDSEHLQQIDIENVGHVWVVIKEVDNEFLSMFAGEHLTNYRLETVRKAVSSTKSILKKILNRELVLLKNVELFALAVDRGKIVIF